MKPKTESKAPELITILNLDQLQARIDSPVYCDFSLDGTPIRIPCKRASQDIEEQILAIRREAQPPFRKERGTNGEYDFGDPAFTAKQAKNEKIARALRVYTCCPMVAEKKPGLTNKEEIYQFVKTAITSDVILDLIAATTQGGGVGLIEKVNFPLAAGSES